MSDALEKLAQTPLRVSHAGIEYELSPMRLQEIAEYRAWAKQRIVADARETLAALGTDCPEDIKRQVWLDAVNDCKRPLASQATNTAEGLQEFVYLCLKVKHPSATRELAKQILANDQAETLAQRLRGLNLAASDEVEESVKN